MIRRRMQIYPGNSIDHGHQRESTGKGDFITVPGRGESLVKAVRGWSGREGPVDVNGEGRIINMT